MRRERASDPSRDTLTEAGGQTGEIVMTMLRALPALLCLAHAWPAAAQTAGGSRAGTLDEARAHLRAGERFYDEARYDEAAREMEAAYAIRAAPDLQYNIAQCYERL